MTGQRKQPERPKITQEHTRFAPRVAAVAQDMYRHTMETIDRRFGTPPSAAAQKMLSGVVGLSLRFSSASNALCSHPLPGSIAGSDYFTISEIQPPEDSWIRGQSDEQMRGYPGRIINMELLYGEPGDASVQTWAAKLYAVPETPPVLVDEGAAKGFIQRFDPKGSWDTATAAGTYLEKMPEHHIHFPEAAELSVVLDGLTTIYDDIAIKRYLHSCRTESEYLRRDDPAFEPDRIWFLAQENKC